MERRQSISKAAVGTAGFWLADESPELKNSSPERLGGGTARMVVVVDDPDALFNQAVAPVVDQPYGWRVGRLADPDQGVRLPFRGPRRALPDTVSGVFGAP